MADYWKSQPRKFCQYCKCWIADNKPSIEFHERGKNHKENVAAKISEIKKKSVEKAKQEERMSKQFAAMEEAAMKAYEEDLKRMDMEAKGLTYVAPAAPPPKPQAKPQPMKPKKPERGRGRGRGRGRWRGEGDRPRPPVETPVWVEGLSDEGHTYYYNTITGESRWEKPEPFQGESSVSAQYEQPEVAPSSSGCAWMEAVSPEGHTYYYNSATGESSWEKPADFPSDEPSESTESGREEESGQEPPAPQDEAGEGGAGEASEEAEASEESSQQPRVPKISFRKRKVESEALDEEEESSEDKSGADAAGEDAETKKEEEEVQSGTVEPEKTKAQSAEGPAKAKRPKGPNPYGVWEKIKEEVDPYTKVDLQLPQVEESAGGAPAELPPEPKPKFKERVITSLGEDGGGPASFRKSKTHNGKSRRLRQRDDND